MKQMYSDYQVAMIVASFVEDALAARVPDVEKARASLKKAQKIINAVHEWVEHHGERHNVDEAVFNINGVQR